MKKRNLIIFISSAIFLLLVGVSVYAAFVYNMTVTSNNVSGNIVIPEPKYISYAINQDASRTDFTNKEDFQAVLKERAGGSEVDTEAVDFKSSYQYYYIRTITEATSYSSGTNYFIKDDTNNYVYRNIESFLEGETYYTITYNQVSSANYIETATQVSNLNNFDSSKAYYKLEGGNYVYQNITQFENNQTYYTCKYTYNTQAEDKNYYRLGHQYDSTVTSSNFSDNDYYILSERDSAGYGLFTKATSFVSGTRYYKIIYVPSEAQTSGLISDTNSEYNGLACVNTYGTERTGSRAETENHMYLNQVGFEFSIQTNIACYVRIKFRDAWVSSKLYAGSSTPLVRYTHKDTSFSGRTPFYVNDENWYFDSRDNVAYLRTYITPRDKSYSYSFNINPSYFYVVNSRTFEERMIVQVSYSVEVIQANRAKAVWNVDPLIDLPSN